VYRYDTWQFVPEKLSGSRQAFVPRVLRFFTVDATEMQQERRKWGGNWGNGQEPQHASRRSADEENGGERCG